MTTTMTQPRFRYDIQLPDQRLTLELSGSMIIYTGTRSGKIVREVGDAFSALALEQLARRIAAKNGGSVITK